MFHRGSPVDIFWNHISTIECDTQGVGECKSNIICSEIHVSFLLIFFSFPINLEWGSQTVSETVYWFQYEQDTSLNSNVYDVAAELVQKHFPGEFGSERLVQKVVDIILRQTAKKEGENKGENIEYG